MFRHFSWRLLLTTIISAAGSSFQFYNGGIINTTQDIIYSWINETYTMRGTPLKEVWLTLYWSAVVGCLHLGACIGCTISGSLADSCGRKNALLFSGVSNVLAAVLVGIAKYTSLPELLLIGRTMFGLNLGMASGIVPMYVTEAAPVRYRGSFGTSHMIVVAFGDLFAIIIGLPQILGSESLWPLAFALPGIPALVMSIILPFCYDSPRYLMIKRKDPGAAYDALVFFLGESNADEAHRALVHESNYLELCAARNHQRSPSLTGLLCLDELRMPLLISILAMIGQQFTGVVVMFSYSTDIFQGTGMNADSARLSTVGIGAAYFICALSSIYFIEKVGRRKLSIFQLSGCFVTLLAFTIVNGLPKNLMSLSTVGIISTAVMVCYMCIYGVGSPIPWMISSELFTQEYRPLAVSASTFISWFLSFVISTFFLPFSRIVGNIWSFIPFLTVTLICVSLLAYLLPETRNKTVEEIANGFRRRTDDIKDGELQGLLEENKHYGSLSSDLADSFRYGSFGGLANQL